MTRCLVFNEAPTSEIDTTTPPSFSGNSFGGREEAKKRKRATDIASQHISAFRTISSQNSAISICSNINKKLSGKITFGTCELDSKADTCCLGANFIPVYYTNRVVNVIPYNNDEKAQVTVPVVSGATAYTCQETGETTIIWIHEGLFFGEGLPGHSLVNPNQLRHFGLTVQDNPYDNDKEMSIEGIDSNDNKFYLPLFSKGVDIFSILVHLLIWNLIRVYIYTLPIHWNGIRVNWVFQEVKQGMILNTIRKIMLLLVLH